ncbi:ATP-binding protein [Streptomyces sp. SA3_actF]|uniref:ATP-binding protein n=1 Tax=Streptomyces sp. SA3_actF TaxID=682181 RepID=UPI001F19A281|nr:ATP-binding protein [Streptomyces sp. SA3_actF]
MAKLRLTVGRGHVEELARLRHPVGAVEELIWNSLDADAENVTVLLERNDIGGVDRVAVIDDGTGIPAEKCAERFEQIGTSWKKRAQVSEVKKRVLHGKNGRGRVRAFALGSEVRWSSVSEAPGAVVASSSSPIAVPWTSSTSVMPSRRLRRRARSSRRSAARTSRS